MEDLTLLEQIFQKEGSLAIAYASILALINIRNMHLSQLAREMGNMLSGYLTDTKREDYDASVITNKKYQISEFTKRYRRTGNASLSLILIIPTYFISRILHTLRVIDLPIYLLLGLCVLLFIYGTAILIRDLVLGDKTLHVNNLLVNLETAKIPADLNRDLDDFSKTLPSHHSEANQDNNN